MIGIQDFLKYRSIGDLSLSPKGNFAVYLVQQAALEENGYTRELWLTRLPGGETRRLLENGSFSGAFYWESDAVLCYLAPAAQGKTVLCRLNVETGAEETAAVIPAETPEVWPVPGGFVFRKAEQLIREEYPEELSFLHDHAAGFETIDEIPLWDNGRGFISGKRSALYFTDFSGNLTKLTHDHTNVDTVLQKEEGLYYTARTYRGRNTEPGIYFLGNGSLENKCLVPEGRYRISHLEAEGGKLYFTGLDKTCTCMTDDHSFFAVENGQVVRLNIPECSVDDSVSADCMYCMNPDFEMRDGAFYYAFTGEWDSFVRKTTLEGESALLTPRGGSISGFRLLPDGKILYVGFRGTRLQELYLWDGEQETQLTHINEALDQKEVIQPEQFTFRNGGFNVNYTVLKPANFDPEKKYPSILYIHGGAKILYTTVFFHEMQFLASQGYFVIYGNPHGSDGQGSDFARLLGHYGEQDFADIMAAMDKALELYPNIDETRMGVAGGSYGGIMTNWTVTHTDRFQAAVAQRSICSMVSTFGTADNGFGFVKEQMDGDLWNGFDNLWRQSPLKYADQCHTPLLLIHSEEDYRCHYTEAIQMFTALKYLGVETEVVFIRGENHSLSRSGRPVQRIKRLYEIQRWFDRHLKEAENG